jgi:hypothetical protein
MTEEKKVYARDVIPGFDEFLEALSKEPYIQDLAEDLKKLKEKEDKEKVIK